MSQDVFSKIGFFEDFLGMEDDGGRTLSDATSVQYNSLLLVPISGDVNMDSTVDEPGGVVAFSGAAGAGDGIALLSSPFCPADGPISMGIRFKYSAVTDMRAFIGFIQTADRDETLNPATLSGTTLTVNNTGETFGFYIDTGATTDDWRVISHNGTAIDTATGMGTLGVRANSTPAADSWIVMRVEIDPNGAARAYLGDSSVDPAHTGPKLIYSLASGFLSVAATTMYHPFAFLGANSTGDPTTEVDYFWGTASRDWTN